MKKAIAIFFSAIMIFAFSACGAEKKSEAPDINKLFSSTAELEYGKFKAAATFNRLGNSMWDVEFSEPKTLSGVKLSYNGTDFSASYQGLAFSVPKDAVPVKGMLLKIFTAIDNAAAGLAMECSEKDGVVTYSGELDDKNEEYSISMAKSDGALVKFELPKEKLCVNFTNFNVIQ